jgi:hypothetical protein
MSETETIVLEPEHLHALREKYPDALKYDKSDGSLSFDSDKLVDVIDNERGPEGILKDAKVTTVAMPEEHDLAVPSGGRLKIKAHKRRGGRLVHAMGGNAAASFGNELKSILHPGGGFAATAGGGPLLITHGGDMPLAKTLGGGYAVTAGGGLAKLDESYGREGFVINSQPGLGYIRKY